MAIDRTGNVDLGERRARPKRKTMKDEVAVYVREHILGGDWPAGTKIDLDQIGEHLGLSKLPVREALIQLESEGLIESEAHRGSYVAMTTPDDVRDHYNIYGLVCGLAASRAATTMSKEGLDRLESICDQMEGSNDPVLLQNLNVEFHRLVNREGGSRRMLAVLRYLANSLPGRFYEFATGWDDEANRHHREILELLRAGKSEEAGRAMAEHTRLGAEVAVQRLQERGFWAGSSVVEG